MSDTLLVLGVSIDSAGQRFLGGYTLLHAVLMLKLIVLLPFLYLVLLFNYPLPSSIFT